MVSDSFLFPSLFFSPLFVGIDGHAALNMNGDTYKISKAIPDFNQNSIIIFIIQRNMDENDPLIEAKISVKYS